MTSHYFSDHRPVDSSQLRPVHWNLDGRELTCHTAEGVFSTDGLDHATALLLETVAAPPAGRVVDLGCGWGPIALAQALRQPAAEVWALDVNPRALDLAARNAAACGATSVRVMHVDDALVQAREQGLRFDALWSNPPVRIGKAALRDLLRTWLSLLADTGEATFVMGRHLGADSMARWLDTQGFATRRLAAKRGFRVIRCSPGPTPPPAR